MMSLDEASRQRLRELAEENLRDSIRVKGLFLASGLDTVLEMAQTVAQAFRDGRRLFLFGNGGSAADAQHLAAEFVNRFVRERPPLPAIALTVDTSIITSIGNDYRFEDIFVKQLQALAQAGDVALGISTSGRSPNVIAALRWARDKGLVCLGWTGSGESTIDACCHRVLHAPSAVTARIQECHITAGHVLCALVEEMLFGDGQ